MTKTIKDLTVNDEGVELNVIIANVTNGKTNGQNKTAYLSFVFQDQSGVIDAKLWNAKKEQIEKLVTGVVVTVKGDIIKYGSNLQMKIETVKFLSIEETEQVKYLKTAPLTGEELFDNISNYISKINNKDIYTITQYLLEKHKEQLMIFPAASRNHHEYVSGLSHHVVGMLKIADALIEVYPTLNKDYLYAGIVLHDIGKILELSGPVLPEYTVKGKLLGHISIGAAMIKNAATKLGIDSENVDILMHLVLSHHGKLEYGSPVLPLIKEAEVLSIIDNLDARINMLDKALETTEEGSFSKRIFPLESRSFYKPK